MINKVEVKLDTEAISDENGNIDGYLQNTWIDNYYNKLIASEATTDDEGNVTQTNHLFTAIESSMQTIANGFGISTAAWGTYHDTLDDLIDYVQEPNSITTILESLSTHGADGEYFKDFFYDTILNFLKPYCHWENISKVQIVYGSNSYANAMKFNRTPVSLQSEDEINYNMTDNSFVFYIFGNYGTENKSPLNKVTTFKLLNTNNELIASISGVDFMMYSINGGNQYVTYLCNPVGGKYIEISNEKPYTYTISNYNLNTELNIESAAENFDKNWPGDVDGFLKQINENSKFPNEGESLSSLTLEFTYPIITDITPTWTQKND